MSAEVAARANAYLDTLPTTDVGGIGGTLSGNALSLAAMRSTLEHVLTDEAFERMIALEERWADGVKDAIERHGLLGRPASGLPRRVLVHADAARDGGSRGERRPRARALHAPVRAQPRDPADALPQHGADVAGHDRGRRRRAHEVFDEMAGELTA